jgi:kynureninase
MQVSDYKIFQGFAKALKNTEENLGIPGNIDSGPNKMPSLIDDTKTRILLNHIRYYSQ